MYIYTTPDGVLRVEKHKNPLIGWKDISKSPHGVPLLFKYEYTLGGKDKVAYFVGKIDEDCYDGKELIVFHGDIDGLTDGEILMYSLDGITGYREIEE